MGSTETKSPRRHELLDSLSESFAVFRDCKPLALGIHKAVAERMPQVDKAQLRAAMKIHTASTRYVKMLLSGKDRFDLDGKAAGEVTEEQREVAGKTLRERFKKIAERQKAEARALQEAQREQEAQKLRREKLTLLAARFNKR